MGREGQASRANMCSCWVYVFLSCILLAFFTNSVFFLPMHPQFYHNGDSMVYPLGSVHLRYKLKSRGFNLYLQKPACTCDRVYWCEQVTRYEYDTKSPAVWTHVLHPYTTLSVMRAIKYKYHRTLDGSLTDGFQCLHIKAI